MPDKKLTDNEIVKALKICSTYKGKCTDCPAFVKVDRSNCKKVLLGAVEIINRLEARIGIYETCNARKDEAIKHLEAENEMLKENNKAIMQTIAGVHTEATKEFAEWIYSLFPEPDSELVVISRTGVAKKVNELVGD